MEDKISRELAGFAAETRWEELPDDVIENAKMLLLDSIGCALAGISTDPGKMAIALAKRMGDKIDFKQTGPSVGMQD